MLITEVVPRTLDAVDADAADSRAWLAERYRRPDAAYVRVNMITAVTGAATGPDGTSETLTGGADRALLGVIRRDADAVVVGARTVREEGYVVPRTARLVIVTATGDLAGHRFGLEDAAAAERVLLVCPAGRAEDVRRRVAASGLTVVPAGSGDDLDPRAVIAALAARGLRRLVCEGGPSLATRFAAAGVVDEFCLTVAPTIEPAAHPFLAVDAGSRPRTELAGMLVDEAGFSYLRLRRRSPGPDPVA